MSTSAAPRPVVVGLAGLAVALSGLAVVSTASPAQAAGPGLVISEVYGGGGNSGAALTHDFVELYNSGDAPVSLAGMSLQYASATGTGSLGANSGQLTELSGTLQPGDHFLVQEATGGSAGQALPAPDLADPSPINMSGSSGKVALVTGTTSLACNGGSSPCGAAELARVVDLVGYGTANFFEGSGAAPGLSNTTAALRLADGAQDTDDNAADFEAGAPTPANSEDSGTPAHLVINEVYGGGGNSGANLNADFVELYNPTSGSIPLSGLTLQYRSSGGTGAANGVAALSGTVAAGSHYLVQTGTAGSNGAALPPADLTVTGVNMAAANGTVYLSTSPTALTLSVGSVTGNPDVVDLVGFGSSNTFETAATPAISATTSASRTVVGDDTDDNSIDFQAGAQSPTNSGSVVPDPDPVAATIAEIQGTGGTSPMVGDAVVTEGVVTAMYPDGGYDGMYIQTGGSGGTPDPTPGASDGIFVFGSNSMPTGVAVGDSVEVTGVVTEFGGMTEITPGAGGVAELAAPLDPVIPQTVVPGTDCALPGTDCLTGAALDAAREAHEGEQFRPEGAYTATDVYDGSAYNGGGFSSSMFGEIGLAAESDMPLVTPTEVVDAQDTAGIAARTAYNNAHRLLLDDGSSLNYASSANTDEPFPWFTADHTVRVGAGVTFDAPVVLDYRFGWKLQPQSRVVGAPTGLVTFEQDRPAQPEDVGGDLKLATFNVLNYFTTLGVDYPGCTPFNDRAGNPITVRTCGDGVPGPRGAWNEENFERQQAKIVDSINKLDADIVTLEEIENSLAVDGHDRDEAVSALVDALNADAGSTRWAYVDSPAAVPTSEDVIRNAFIYNPGTVELVGDSEILIDDPAFHNARDPFAQTFKATGGDDADGFAVIANHFKSKGSGFNDGTGQGNANPDRIAQAEALVTFADGFAAANGVEKVYLTGDFNAYSMEDPVQVMTAAGYTSLESTDDPDEETYNFDGQIGSLDHIFANEAAAPDVTGVDIWTTNGYESVYYEYSRFNYNVTNLYADGPFRASDHNPEIVGIDVAAPRLEASLTARHTPTKVRVGHTRAQLRVEVEAAGVVPTGLVEVTLPGGETIVESLDEEGRVTLRLPVFANPGDHEITIDYSGDDLVAGETAEYTVRVIQ